MGPGDHFGERSLLTAEPTVASVVTAAPTQLMALDKATFERILPPLQDLVAREVAIRDMRARRKGQSKISWKDLKVLALLGEGSFGKVRGRLPPARVECSLRTHMRTWCAPSRLAPLAAPRSLWHAAHRCGWSITSKRAQRPPSRSNACRRAS